MFRREFEIPSPEEIAEELPLGETLRRRKEERDRLVRDVIAGRSDKLLLVVGPCSAHEEASVLEYVRRLARLEEQVRDKLAVVPRLYTGKPRSKGVGYMGMVSRPDPERKEDARKGLYAARKLHLDALANFGLSSADEMLYPEDVGYFSDLLSYVAVGARSCEDQLHRLTASGLDVPVGFKNPTGGNLLPMLNSVFAARSAQTFKYRGWQVSTDGNPYAHAVLRGGTDDCGRDFPNYGYECVTRVAEGYASLGMDCPAVMIDANHANSGKDFKKQISIVGETLENRRKSEDFRRAVRGFFIESFLVEGAQEHGDVFGKSITDPCLGWEDTERLILSVAERI